MSDTNVSTICKNPRMGDIQMAREVAELIPVDLNGDGKKDEYFTVNQETTTTCGRLDVDGFIIPKLVAVFGNYLEMKPNGNVTTLVGRLWRAEITVGDNFTRTVIRTAIPSAELTPDASYKVKHLKDQSFKLKDPVTIKDDNKTYVVLDVARQARWDGKSISFGSEALSLQLVTIEGYKKMRDGGMPTRDQIKALPATELKAILSRGSFPEIYGNSKVSAAEEGPPKPAKK
jgi:hypothetical protein